MYLKDKAAAIQRSREIEAETVEAATETPELSPAREAVLTGLDPEGPTWLSARERKEQLAARISEIEELAAKRRGIDALKEYWRTGPGADKINWGTEGDFTRCMRYLSKYLPDDAGGFCQKRHIEIYGMSNAAKDAKAEKKKKK